VGAAPGATPRALLPPVREDLRGVLARPAAPACPRLGLARGPSTSCDEGSETPQCAPFRGIPIAHPRPEGEGSGRAEIEKPAGAPFRGIPIGHPRPEGEGARREESETPGAVPS